MNDTSPLSGEIVADAPIHPEGFTPNLTLPSGGWVTFRDPATLRAKDRDRVLANIVAEDTKHLLALVNDMSKAVAAMLIDAWQVPYLDHLRPDGGSLPLPRDQVWLLGELTIPDEDAILAAVKPAVSIIFPGTTAADAGKPGTPTLPASA
jgi:hypothetical protein